jgi:hypothetical protein
VDVALFSNVEGTRMTGIGRERIVEITFCFYKMNIDKYWFLEFLKYKILGEKRWISF